MFLATKPRLGDGGELGQRHRFAFTQVEQTNQVQLKVSNLVERAGGGAAAGHMDQIPEPILVKRR